MKIYLNGERVIEYIEYWNLYQQLQQGLIILKSSMSMPFSLVYPLTAAIVWVDLATFAMLCYVFYITYKTKEIIDTNTKGLQSYGPKLPGLLRCDVYYA